MTDIKLTLVVACALIDTDKRVLLAQRPEGKAMAGLWEFPGGKLEPGERPEQTLIRELHEELGITVSEPCLAPLTFASHAYEAFHLLMPLYICRRWEGLAVAREGGLPFLALALLREADVRTLLRATEAALSGRPWGVGILGFVPPDLRAEQLRAVHEVRPPLALIAGGRPDQAAELERQGIAAYLHAPSPDLIGQYLRDVFVDAEFGRNGLGDSFRVPGKHDRTYSKLL